MFDAKKTIKESNLIYFYQKDLRPLIQAQIDNQRLKFDSQDKMVAKAIDVEAKTSFESANNIWDINQHCQQKYRLVHTTTAKKSTN